MNHLLGKTTLLGAVLATSLVIVGCSPVEADTEAAQQLVRPVKLLTIEPTNAINVRRFPAELMASEEVDLAFRVGGQVIKLDAVSGKKVTKGDLLATLDPTDFQLQLELAQANQKLAQAQFNRIQTMLRQKVTTQAEFDSAKATLEQANNSVQSAQNQLKYTKVYAPFDGVIASVDIENYQYVSATQTLMHIQNINQLEVDFQVPESLVVSIRSAVTDYHPSVVVDVAPDEVLTGKYKEHKTIPDPNTKAYDATLTLIRDHKGPHTLLPGMTANVDIDLSQLLGETKHITVPTEAVLLHENTDSGESESSVWVFNQETGYVTPRKVTLGELQGSSIEIVAGLEVGDQVVTAGVHTLTEDMKVRPWTRERGL
ncbi:efflux RND transporter periplasmic adaptor subunit [Marinomonas epiphytica]